MSININWVENKTYKRLEFESSAYGHVNVYLIKRYCKKPMYFASYNLYPYILNREVVQSFGIYIANSIKLRPHSIFKRANNIYLDYNI